MSLQSIKLVTFDATNTLLKFRVPPWQHYANVAREYGFVGTVEGLKPLLLNSYNVMWNKYPNFGRNNITWDQWWRRVVKSTFEGQLPSNTDINSIANRLIEEFKTTKCWCTANGGDKIINLFRSRDILIGVISNFDPRLNDILQNMNIYNKFDFVLTSYETGYIKPDERIFNIAIERFNNKIGHSESLHIGDDVNRDYEGARAAGWHAVLVSENIKSEKPPAREHVFKNLDELCLAIECNNLNLCL